MHIFGENFVKATKLLKSWLDEIIFNDSELAFFPHCTMWIYLMLLDDDLIQISKVEHHDDPIELKYGYDFDKLN